MKSKYSIFNRAEVRRQLGQYGEGTLTGDLLKGLTHEKIRQTFGSVSDIATNFIQAIASPTEGEGSTTQPYQWTYGINKYKQTFSKTRESTACGPSGLHMSHWKVGHGQRTVFNSYLVDVDEGVICRFLLATTPTLARAHITLLRCGRFIIGCRRGCRGLRALRRSR